MEELNTPEEQENLNEEQSEEISRTETIECPNCQYTGKAVFETMRRTLGDPKNELDEIVKRMVFKWAQPKLEIIKGNVSRILSCNCYY